MKFLLILLILSSTILRAQVFNYGHQDLAFKQLLKNGVCFLKTGDEKFDSTMLVSLEEYWTISDFHFVEKYKHPTKESTAFFVTTKKKIKKHVMDRKNRHVLVLQPQQLWKKDKQVPFDQTLGYMYFNGFYEMLEEDEEYLFVRYMVQCLNKGLTIIKEKRFHNNNHDLNEQIAEAVREEHKGLLGNTLILNREFLVHFIEEKKLKKFEFTYRLHAKDEFFNALNTTLRTHYILYYSVNTKTDLALINVLTGEMIYTKHFKEGYTELKPKELKLIASFF